MASSRAVANALKILSRAFAGTVDAERIELYRVALDDLSDESLMAAAVHVVKTHTGEFIPPPGVLRKALSLPKAAAMDSGALVRQIEKLATYNPNSGMIYPPIPVVQERLGDAAAYAYAAAGGQRLFSENATSRDIAERDFTAALVDISAKQDLGVPLLAANTTRRLKDSA